MLEALGLVFLKLIPSVVDYMKQRGLIKAGMALSYKEATSEVLDAIVLQKRIDRDLRANPSDDDWLRDPKDRN